MKKRIGAHSRAIAYTRWKRKSVRDTNTRWKRITAAELNDAADELMSVVGFLRSSRMDEEARQDMVARLSRAAGFIDGAIILLED